MLNEKAPVNSPHADMTDEVVVMRRSETHLCHHEIRSNIPERSSATLPASHALQTPPTSTCRIIRVEDELTTTSVILHLATGLGVQLPNRDWGYVFQSRQSDSPHSFCVDMELNANRSGFAF